MDVDDLDEPTHVDDVVPLEGGTGSGWFLAALVLCALGASAFLAHVTMTREMDFVRRVLFLGIAAGVCIFAITHATIAVVARIRKEF